MQDAYLSPGQWRSVCFSFVNFLRLVLHAVHLYICKREPRPGACSHAPLLSRKENEKKSAQSSDNYHSSSIRFQVHDTNSPDYSPRITVVTPACHHIHVTFSCFCSPFSILSLVFAMVQQLVGPLVLPPRLTLLRRNSPTT